MGEDKASQYLHGYSLQGWFAPDITDDGRTGLGRWSGDDIAAFLKTGHNRVGAAVGPMAEEVMHASSAMSDRDLKAIATYLKDQPGHSEGATPLPENDPQMIAGQAIYRDQCAACHQIDGKGVARLFPSLADSSVARSDDPTSLLRLLLRGSRSVATKDEPTGPGMPSFGWQLNDHQIAAVATSLGQSCGRGFPERGSKATLQTREPPRSSEVAACLNGIHGPDAFLAGCRGGFRAQRRNGAAVYLGFGLRRPPCAG
jgi:mono/diheme cytochrome c family protein